MATEYVIRNTQNRPDRSGVVRPFLTRMFDGRQYPVVVTDAELEGVESLGELVPVPDGLETVPLRAKDTHDLLRALIAEQALTRRASQALLNEFKAAERQWFAPKPRALTRWERFKFWLRLKLTR
jgi:hypothetical protein